MTLGRFIGSLAGALVRAQRISCAKAPGDYIRVKMLFLSRKISEELYNMLDVRAGRIFRLSSSDFYLEPTYATWKIAIPAVVAG